MVLFPEHPFRKEIYAWLSKHGELFQSPIPSDWKLLRELTQKQFRAIHGSGLIQLDDFDKTDRLWVLCEILHWISPSLAITLGVNFVLFAGAVYFLGTERHRQLLTKFLQGDICGCFAMTEIGHGSNLKGLETTLTIQGDKILINTPNNNAIKCWIGGGTLADYAVVWGHLIDGEKKNHGLQAVIVPTKNTPGVVVKDMEAKMGLNGVDNCYIQFTQVEVPLENFLDRFGQIKDGKYTSQIKNPDQRFGRMLSALSLGRISIALGSYAILDKALHIALGYNLKRRQFSFDKKQEKRVIEYSTQAERFANIISTLEMGREGILYLIEKYRSQGVSKEVHGLSSLLKVWMSSQAVKSCSELRNMCGGHGYLFSNQLGLLQNDVHVYQTFEGENYVLIQQGVKWLLDTHRNTSKDLISLAIRLKTNKRGLTAAWLENLREIYLIGNNWIEKFLFDLMIRKNAQNVWSRIITSRISQKSVREDLYTKIIQDKEFEKYYERVSDLVWHLKTIPLFHYPNMIAKL